MIINSIHEGQTVEFSTHKMDSVAGVVKLTRLETKDTVTSRYFWFNEAQLRMLAIEVNRLLGEFNG